MANVVYNKGRELLANADFDMATAELYLLLTLAYTPSINGDSYVSSVVSKEITGTGYVRKALDNRVLTRDTVNNRMVLTADDITWTGATFSADGAVIYINSGTDATSSLITYLDFGVVKSSANTNFVIEWGVEGILNVR